MTAASTESSRPKKKAKRDRAPGEANAPAGADAELEALNEAFARGNYRRVREEAPSLAKKSKDPAVRRAAEELARRVEPDSISVYLVALAGVLLMFLAVWYWTHPHGQP